MIKHINISTRQRVKGHNSWYRSNLNLSNSLKQEQFAVDDPTLLSVAGTGSQTNGGSGSESRLLSILAT
jgi:hypothetical protein